MAITSDEIVRQLDEALKKFGTYSFDDKGSQEVMDTDVIANKLMSMSAHDAGIVMKEVQEKNVERGSELVEDLVGYMDNQPDDWFNEMVGIVGIYNPERGEEQRRPIKQIPLRRFSDIFEWRKT